jgi:hypothetical protein
MSTGAREPGRGEVQPASSTTPSVDPNAQLVRIVSQVNDAKFLLSWAVSHGKTIEDRIVTIICDFDKGLPDTARMADACARFAAAYRDLVASTGGVTAATLHATNEEGVDLVEWRIPILWRIPLLRFPVGSVAKRWSMRLWLYTAVFALVIIGAENYDEVLNGFFARDESTEGPSLWWYITNTVLQNILPFAYGGLGAATYLLRSAHVFLHERTFDPNRIPEYFNRLLVGAIAGGTIKLLVNQVPDAGATIEVSGAALGFVAGYNADLLFRSVERVIEALLPRVGVETLRRQRLTVPPLPALQVLTEQMMNAQNPEDKEVIRGLIAKVKERM